MDQRPKWVQLGFATEEEWLFSGYSKPIPFDVERFLASNPDHSKNGQANGSGNGHDAEGQFVPTESIISGAELDTHKFAPVEWIIDDVLPTGLAILAGKSKIGKSWLAMDISVAVARGVPV